MKLNIECGRGPFVISFPPLPPDDSSISVIWDWKLLSLGRALRRHIK